MIIDGTNLILGRLASFAAKQALLGEEVTVVNCENVIISGSKKTVMARFYKIMDLGSNKPLMGPFVARMPDRIVRHAIKRMVQPDKAKGREAYHRVSCYLSIPEECKNQEMITVKEADGSKLSTLKYMTLKEVAKEIGGRV
jgi:large subunit ribosomal protein L13